jgi:hypothetical protein
MSPFLRKVRVMVFNATFNIHWKVRVLVFNATFNIHWKVRVMVFNATFNMKVALNTITLIFQ